MIPPAAIADLKARHPVHEIAGTLVALRRHGRGFIGPCPICSNDPRKHTSTRFECDSESWKCAVCCDGGDVIALVQRTQQIDFPAVVEWLGGAQQIDPEVAEKRAQEALARRERREKEAAHYRERERRELWGIWQSAQAPEGSAVEAYLKLRGVTLPPRARLRCAGDFPFYAHGGRGATIIHRGPAMLAAITGPDSRFAALHMTWLDLDRPSGKIDLKDVEGNPLPAKKVRGSKHAGIIDLIPNPQATTWFMGEGIETTLSVREALLAVGRSLDAMAFICAVDLGNLGGPHASTIPHLTARGTSGRIKHIPGPDPDFDQPGIAVPDHVTEIILLGDGDSDPELTKSALARAAKRYARESRRIVAAWAPQDMDFNDVLRGI